MKQLKEIDLARVAKTNHDMGFQVMRCRGGFFIRCEAGECHKEYGTFGFNNISRILKRLYEIRLAQGKTLNVEFGDEWV